MRDEIKNAMARAAFVQAWASYQEEQGVSLRGELMDQAPETSKEAFAWASNLLRCMEQMNDKPIEQMYSLAAAMDGKHYKEPTPEDFGHYSAMQAVGHGVAWSDDHPDHGFKLPHGEFYMFNGDDGEPYCEGWVK